ncbi:MAG: hypothetical protein AB7O97_01995 [Planctomycetota bacterium]
MLAALDWSTLAGNGVILAVTVLGVARIGRGRPAAAGWDGGIDDEGQDTGEDPPPVPSPLRASPRRVLGNALALAFGAGCGVLLEMLTRVPDAPLRFSPFEGAGRWLAPFFVMLGVGAIVAVPLLARLDPDAPPRPSPWGWFAASRATAQQRLGALVVVLALMLHFALRDTYVELDDDGVRWRDWPMVAEQRSWSELRDVRVVRTFTAMTGRVVERPRLALEFGDGAVMRVGQGGDRPPGFWEEPAAFAAARGGVAVRRVEHE